MPNPFELDPRIAAATVELGAADALSFRMMNDRRYPWIVIVPQRPDLVELFDLTTIELNRLMGHAARIAGAMAQRFAAEKINIATLGNRVRQLHLHIVARRSGDAAWPDAVWNGTPAEPYAAAEAEAMRGRLHDCLDAPL